MRYLFCLILLISSPAFGAVYLDGTTSGCSNGSTNYDPATRSCGSGSNTVYDNLASFSSGIVAGATNYMRAGTYLRDTGDSNIGSLHISSSKSGTSGSPTIVTAYTGEERQVLIGTATRGTTYNSDPSDATGAGSYNYYPNRSMMTYDASYVTISGVKTYGQVYLAGGHDVIVQDSDMGGGGASAGSPDQGNTLRMNNIYAFNIKNNYIHHNCRRGEDNTGTLIIIYVASGVFEQNTFENFYGNVLENKDSLSQSGRTTEIKYNFFGNTTISPIDTAGFRGMIQNVYLTNQYIHHNIFINKTYGVRVFQKPSGDNIFYNNTFVNCDDSLGQPTSGSTDSFKSYNNIVYNSSSGKEFVHLYAGLSQLTGSDYNIYYNTGIWTTGLNPPDAPTTVATTLSGWQSYSSMDAASLAVDPGFVNASGSAPADFKRSSYADGFSGSPYSVTAGAYETGTEQIGYDWTGGNSSPTATITTPTSSPTYSTSTAVITVSGTASDSDGTVSSVTWACPTCTPTSGAATGTTSWTFGATLASGSNSITVTAHDDQGATGSDTLTATYSTGETPATSGRMIYSPTRFAPLTVSGWMSQ